VENESRPVGFLDSFRALGESLVVSLHDRIELVAVELQEEKFRLIQIFFWISAVVFTAMMTIVFASLTLVYLFWDSARLTALGGLTIVYAGVSITVIVLFRRYLSRQPQPFAATTGELTRDRACLQSGN
jgi:uncharacterized membrane protein YqjE